MRFCQGAGCPFIRQDALPSSAVKAAALVIELAACRTRPTFFPVGDRGSARRSPARCRRASTLRRRCTAAVDAAATGIVALDRDGARVARGTFKRRDGGLHRVGPHGDAAHGKLSSSDASSHRYCSHPAAAHVRADGAAPRTTNRSTSKTSATKAAPMGVTLRFLIPLHSLLSFRQNQALKSAGRSLRQPKCHKIASAMRAQAWPSP